MKNILLLNKIAKAGTDCLDPGKYRYGTETEAPEGILVRSAKMHDMELGKNLLAIARAGAGVNNIPVERCSDAGIVVFNTPGANANGVKELTLCALFLAARRVVDGVIFARSLAGTMDVAKQVEAGKSAFGGTELYGKTLGVIGLGAIGGMVANAALSLGMNVIGYDPYLSVDSAWNMNHLVKKATSFEEVFAGADYLTLHVPATAETTGMIHARAIAGMKDGVRIINLARAELVCAADLAAAMSAGKVGAYVTDFPTEETVAIPGAVTIPHLGACTEESEEKCAMMAAAQLDDYLTFGNIRNSVNYPDVACPAGAGTRVCVLHANIPATLTRITTVFSEQGINIENMLNRSKGANAYTMLDVNSGIGEGAVMAVGAIEGVRRVRVIRLAD